MYKITFSVCVNRIFIETTEIIYPFDLLNLIGAYEIRKTKKISQTPVFKIQLLSGEKD